MRTQPSQYPVTRFLLGAVLLLVSPILFAADTDGDGIPEGNTVRQISAGNLTTCALDANGVHCWGNYHSGQTVVPALTNPVAVITGVYHTCALDDNGVHCWGANLYGQTTVPPLTNPVAVSVGWFHTCALDASGVTCWGRDSDDETTVPPLTNPVAVSAGWSYTCALDTSGVICWGNQQATVPPLTNPVAVSSGGWHTCALDDNGVHCWGDNGYGQTTVPPLTNPVAVSAGFAHTCALDAGGVHCWGDNSDGQTTVPVLTNPVPVSAGGAHTCALDDNGLHCWGANPYGQATVPAALRDDNCPHVANVNQSDSDGDRLGDVCDPLPEYAGALNVVDGIRKGIKFGTTVAFVGDFNGDGFGDYAIGTPRADAPVFNTSKTLKQAGRVNVVSGNDGSVLASMTGTAAKDALGYALAGGKDLDGDGLADVVVSAPYADSASAKDVGAVYVLPGSADNSSELGEPVFGTEAKAMFGAALALGDFNNDSSPDLIVGSPNAKDVENNRAQAGKVYVFDGSDQGNVLGIFYGATAKARAGTAVAGANVDGNAGDDVIIGAPLDDNNNLFAPLKDAGSVTVYTFATTTPFWTAYGTAKGARFGQAVAAGNVAGDTAAEVLVGAPMDDDTGKTRKDTGSITLLASDGSEVTAARRYGATAKAALGSRVALGDVNGDGKADLMASAPKDDRPISPKITTSNTGSVSVWDGADYTVITTVYGEVAKDYFGAALGAGDINRDGNIDIIVGIPGFDTLIPESTKTTKDAGAVTVLNATELYRLGL